MAAEFRLIKAKQWVTSMSVRSIDCTGPLRRALGPIFVAEEAQKTDPGLKTAGNLENTGLYLALEERMDQERARNMVTNAAEKISGTASDTAEQVGVNMKDTLDQGKAIARDVQAGAAALGRQASEVGQQAMAQAGEVIQGAAREAGKQATQAANSLYQQSSRAGDHVSRYAAEQPVTAMLIAGAIGYGLAYLIHRR